MEEKNSKRKRLRPLIYAVMVSVAGIALWIHGRKTLHSNQQQLLNGSYAEFITAKKLDNVIQFVKFAEFIYKGNNQVSFAIEVEVLNKNKLDKLAVKLDKFPFRGEMFEEFSDFPDCRFIKNPDTFASTLIVSNGEKAYLIGDNWKLNLKNGNHYD